MSDSSSSTQVVNVNLESNSYEIEIGNGCLPKLAKEITKSANVSHVVVITDENVNGLYAERVQSHLLAGSLKVDCLVVPAGESTKCVQLAETLWNQLRSLGADRKTMVLALGGGVVGDLAGFIAATYGRGVPFFQVPTTLLAQVDSSVGGKVGINLPNAKNMVGAFWQPHGVLIDVEVLKTLNDREYKAGMAEVIKYGMILDEPFFEFLEQNIDAINRCDRDVLIKIVKRCCELKADIVQRDERETLGIRAVLNYGHTFGHAFEAETGYSELLHGEGVSIGMVCAAKLSVALGRIDQSIADRQFELLQGIGLPTRTPEIDLEKAIQAMGRDKKVEHGKLRFILPSRIGHVELVGDVSKEQILDSMQNNS